MISTSTLLLQVDLLRFELAAMTEERDALLAILELQPPNTPDKN